MKNSVQKGYADYDLYDLRDECDGLILKRKLLGEDMEIKKPTFKMRL
jgi:hypothetical protein